MYIDLYNDKVVMSKKNSMYQLPNTTNSIINVNNPHSNDIKSSRNNLTIGNYKHTGIGNIIGNSTDNIDNNYIKINSSNIKTRTNSRPSSKLSAKKINII